MAAPFFMPAAGQSPGMPGILASPTIPGCVFDTSGDVQKKRDRPESPVSFGSECKEKMKKENIILIGMPGAGKSSIGVILAKALGYEFVDTDLVIQAREGCLLCEIIEKKGEKRFLEIENEVNAELDVKKCVIAPGGSVIYGIEAMEHFREIGTIVYLELPYEDLKKRLGNLKGRGVVLKEGQSLKELYEERTRLYEKYADLTISEKDRDIEATLQAILDELEM